MGCCNSPAKVFLALALAMLVGGRANGNVEIEGSVEDVCDIGEESCLDHQCCSPEKCVAGKECCEANELPPEGSGNLWPEKCSRCSDRRCETTTAATTTPTGLATETTTPTTTTPTGLATWVIVVIVIAPLAVIAALGLGLAKFFGKI